MNTVEARQTIQTITVYMNTDTVVAQEKVQLITAQD
jgi:hypothetical protein